MSRNASTKITGDLKESILRHLGTVEENKTGSEKMAGKNKGRYSMFHVTWSTFKFNRNQPRTVSAFVMISMPGSNQRAHQVISEKLLFNEFHCGTTDHK